MEKSTRLFLIASAIIFLVLLLGCSGKNRVETQKKTVRGEEKVMDSSFKLMSPAFKDGEMMPAKYANIGVVGGQNLSLSLKWENPPEGTKSFAIANVDRHPIAGNFVHWLAINIPANVTSLREGASGRDMPPGSIELRTSYGVSSYGGPRPPAGTGDHDYENTIYALSVEKLELSSDATYQDFQRAIQGKVLATAKLVGLFSQ
jgi:hypothetical protein